MNQVCESCGESNPPGTEFCTNCNSFLAWDGSTAVGPTGGAAAPGPAAVRTAPTSSHPSAATAVSATTEADSTFPDQGDPGQTYPDQTGADQGYLDQDYSGQDYSGDGYAGQDFSCPDCGQVNPTTRRFCSRCGYAFFSSETYDPYSDPASSFSMSVAAQDRAAKREYRRSLPPLYRWRRVLITVLVVVLAAVAGAVVNQDPVGMVKGGWYRLNQQYLLVSPIQVTIQPPEATAKSDPTALVDGSVVEWTMNWVPGQVTGCAAPPGTGQIVLSFPATRIRQVQVFAGLAADNPQRNLQPLPKTLGLSFDNGPCQAHSLSSAPDRQVINIDSGQPVTQLRISIASAYPGGADAAPLVSLTEVILKSFPR